MKNYTFSLIAVLISVTANAQETLDLEFDENYFSCPGEDFLINDYCEGTDDNYHFSWQQQVDDEWIEIDNDCEMDTVLFNTGGFEDYYTLRLQVTYSFTDDTTTSESFTLSVAPQFEWEFEIGDVYGDSLGCEILLNCGINTNSLGFDVMDIGWTSENLDWSLTSWIQLCFNPFSTDDMTGVIHGTICEGHYGCCVDDTTFVVFSDNGDGVWGPGDSLSLKTIAPPGFGEDSTETSVTNLNTQFSIYPNPARDRIVIEQSLANSGVVRVMNYTGAILKEEKIISPLHEIDIAELPKGVYLISFQDGNSSAFKRLVKY